jgi:DnaJ family protein A protein 5
MGSQQSISSSQPQENMKTCYYELIGVARDATQDEIKKAYRKAALQWHPDKNYDKIEEATRIFAQIQVAYDVLSDEQERAWYDGHREQILRDNEDFDEEAGEGAGGWWMSENHLMRYYSVECFTGYNDSDTGFYAVYRELFTKLAQQEMELDNQAVADLDPHLENVYTNIPFGHSGSKYEEDDLSTFYLEWLNFSSRRSFAWLDKWRLSDAPNRQYKRGMEKDNKKARDAGRRAYNDVVRSLAAFVRKRDPRYKAYMEQVNQRKRVQEEEAKARLEQQRRAAQIQAQEFQEQHWMKVHEKQMDEEDDVEDEEEAWECVLCEKLFKSERALANHETSKAHQQMKRLVRNQFLKQEGKEEEETVVQVVSGDKKKKAKSKHKTPQYGHEHERELNVEHVDDLLSKLRVESDTEEEPSTPQRKSRRKKKTSETPTPQPVEIVEEEEGRGKRGKKLQDKVDVVRPPP